MLHTCTQAIEDGTLDEVKEKRRRSGKPSSANSSLQVSEAEDDDSDGEPRKVRLCVLVSLSVMQCPTTTEVLAQHG